MFHTVLIANRGEIAMRAIRTLKEKGIRSVAVYSEPDRNAAHVRAADVAVALGGEKASDSYLSIPRLLEAAASTGAQAIFPGYGFLSESAEFADACEAEGIAFVGPTAQQMREFGLKHRARELAQAAGVPLAPGTGLLKDIEQAKQAAVEIGYPVMLKSTAGGGGIGLTRCYTETELEQAFESVQRLGQNFFSDGGVFLERYIENARHIEVQIFGDGAGKVIALGERDCSVQRRNQKVVEETPAPHLSDQKRAAILAAAVHLGELVSYRSAGTVEFIYDGAREEFYFLEVNTRLQVEHPITEMVTGVDLVDCMLRVAAQEALDWTAMTRSPQGAAMEVRVYAEDPLKQFQPSPGVLTEVLFPSSARIDTWVATGTAVSSFYDPMIAKIIVHGATREEARQKMQQALAATRLQGIATNLDYLRDIIASDRFAQGLVATNFLDSFVYQPRVLEVLEAGTYTTIQDYPGRVGYWSIGVPPSGPMDDFAFRIANRIVGNCDAAAGIEITLVGPKLRFHQDAIVAVTGAQCELWVDGVAVPLWTPVAVAAGQVLQFGKASSGCRSYLAVRGGLDVPVYLGSRSTFVLGEFGGHAGRTLRAGDIVAIGNNEDTAGVAQPLLEPCAYPAEAVPSYGKQWEIQVLYGPHGAPDFFTTESITTFFANDWEVHYNSNRLGVRLLGPKPEWARSDGGEAGLHPSNIHDCEYAIGSINFTGDSPVILTRDGPSLGGFVCPVTIIKADLWKVGQVKPGDRIRFVPVSFAHALELEQGVNRSVAMLAARPELALPEVNLAPQDTPSATIVASRAPDGHHPLVTYRQAGDAYLLLEYGENVLDLALRLRVYLMMEALKAQPIAGIIELSPGVRSLQINYDAKVIGQARLVAILLELEQGLPPVAQLKIPSRVIHLPMAYEDSATLGAVQRYSETVRARAPWLPNNVDFIQRINGLAERDAVRESIFATSYMVMGLGDVYLGAPCAVPLDPRHRLLTSKYNPARTFTAEGTVGIGGVYMCIYGMDSPGGYQLVGRTVPIWNKFLKNAVFHNGEPWLLRFFDQVRFYPVSEAELNQLRDDFREGRMEVSVTDTEFDYAAYLEFLAANADSITDFQTQQKIAFESEVALWKAEEAEQVAAALIASNEPEWDDDAQVVSADICGNVWKILVQPGDAVEAGQVVVIVEAMKMELEMTSSQAGVVKSIICAPGKPVNVGDPILLLE